MKKLIIRRHARSTVFAIMISLLGWGAARSGAFAAAPKPLSNTDRVAMVTIESKTVSNDKHANFQGGEGEEVLGIVVVAVLVAFMLAASGDGAAGAALLQGVSQGLSGGTGTYTPPVNTYTQPSSSYTPVTYGGGHTTASTPGGNTAFYDPTAERMKKKAEEEAKENMKMQKSKNKARQYEAELND